MSAENVELVRRYFESWQRFFEAYWESPRSVVAALDSGDAAPEGEEWFAYLDPELEWNPVFSNESFRGIREGARALDEWFEAAANFRIDLREVSDLGHDRVLVAVDCSLVSDPFQRGR